MDASFCHGTVEKWRKFEFLWMVMRVHGEMWDPIRVFIRRSCWHFTATTTVILLVNVSLFEELSNMVNFHSLLLASSNILFPSWFLDRFLGTLWRVCFWVFSAFCIYIMYLVLLLNIIHGYRASLNLSVILVTAFVIFFFLLLLWSPFLLHFW